MCLFGGDSEDLKLKQTYNGVEKWVNFGEVIIQQMEMTNTRLFQIHNLFFPELTSYYFSKSDRELAKN